MTAREKRARRLWAGGIVTMKWGIAMVHTEIQALSARLASADAVVIGAGAGLSTAAGMTYSGRRFEENFADFIVKYQFADMYSGGFYPFPSLEERWAYWSRYIWINRYQPPPKPVYRDLLELVKDREYFVMTTNVDHCFQTAGFDKRRLFYTQGDYGLWQCPLPCHDKTYDNEDTVRRMVKEQKNMRVPPELVPYCPVCARPMTMNLRCDDTFVQDEGWYQARERYEAFLRQYEGAGILYLELGVGENTPIIIKYPFWQMAWQNPNAFYVSVNLEKNAVPEELAGRSLCITGEIGEVLAQVKQENAQ